MMSLRQQRVSALRIVARTLIEMGDELHGKRITPQRVDVALDEIAAALVNVALTVADELEAGPGRCIVCDQEIGAADYVMRSRHPSGPLVAKQPMHYPHCPTREHEDGD